MRKINIHDKFQDIAKSYEILFIARLEEAKKTMSVLLLVLKN